MPNPAQVPVEDAGVARRISRVVVAGVAAVLTVLVVSGAVTEGGPATVQPTTAPAPSPGPAVVAPRTPAAPTTYGRIGFTATPEPVVQTGEAEVAGPAVAPTAPPKTASKPKSASKPKASTGKAAAPKKPTGATTKTVHGPTSWGALNAAIARIPGYRPGAAHWVVTARYGHWGATDLSTGTVYISPNAPVSRLDSIARHEWAHVIQGRVYGHNAQAAFAAMNRVFGGSGLTGAERSADCMARLLGASWTNYTPCTSAAWRAKAGRLLAGERL